MPAPAAHQQHARASKRGARNPITAGLPDPRPITDYDVSYAEVGGQSVITVTLHQPCVIRDPVWGFVDAVTGATIEWGGKVGDDGASNDTIVFTFNEIIPGTVAFVDVPYQDTQVQNFQGGFVRPGGKWFREPVAA